MDVSLSRYFENVVYASLRFQMSPSKTTVFGKFNRIKSALEDISSHAAITGILIPIQYHNLLFPHPKRLSQRHEQHPLYLKKFISD